jgi:Stigma-specific protein, Stig1
MACGHSRSLFTAFIGVISVSLLGLCACGEDTIDRRCGITETDCDGVCVDLATDRDHCGLCDTSCDASQMCQSGACALGCTGGTTVCGDRCVDTAVDAANCGGCADAPNPGDHRCATGEICDGAGHCALSCQGGLTQCDGECVNLLTDSRYCSNTTDCGTGCPPGETCDGSGLCDLSCGTELTACPSGCADVDNDPGNCGGCADVPTPGEHVCPMPPNTVPVCIGGTCDILCEVGYSDCNALDSDGCESDVSADVTNCGVCGRVCPSGVCENRDCVRRVFSTAFWTQGNMGGLTGGDALCQQYADSVGLGGTYKVWLSDSSGSPATRFTRSAARYLLPNGVLVANNWADLTDGTLVAPINVNEYGGSVSDSMIFTNTRADGSLAFDFSSCANWSSTAGTAWFGWNIYANSLWTDWFVGSSRCDDSGRLYCFEQ